MNILTALSSLSSSSFSTLEPFFNNWSQYFASCPQKREREREREREKEGEVGHILVYQLQFSAY